MFLIISLIYSVKSHENDFIFIRKFTENRWTSSSIFQIPTYILYAPVVLLQIPNVLNSLISMISNLMCNSKNNKTKNHLTSYFVVASITSYISVSSPWTIHIYLIIITYVPMKFKWPVPCLQGACKVFKSHGTVLYWLFRMVSDNEGSLIGYWVFHQSLLRNFKTPGTQKSQLK